MMATTIADTYNTLPHASMVCNELLAGRGGGHGGDGPPAGGVAGG